LLLRRKEGQEDLDAVKKTSDARVVPGGWCHARGALAIERRYRHSGGVLSRVGLRSDCCAATVAIGPEAVRDGLPRVYRSGSTSLPVRCITRPIAHRSQSQQSNQVSPRRQVRPFRTGDRVLGVDGLVGWVATSGLSPTDRVSRGPGSGARSRDVAPSRVRRWAVARALADPNGFADAAARPNDDLSFADPTYRDVIATATDRFAAPTQRDVTAADGGPLSHRPTDGYPPARDIDRATASGGFIR
jgi:hypothetical protein